MRYKQLEMLGPSSWELRLHTHTHTHTPETPSSTQKETPNSGVLHNRFRFRKGNFLPRGGFGAGCESEARQQLRNKLFLKKGKPEPQPGILLGGIRNIQIQAQQQAVDFNIDLIEKENEENVARQGFLEIFDEGLPRRVVRRFPQKMFKLTNIIGRFASVITL